MCYIYPRVVPVKTAGCYVPGGLYGYTVSAVMTAGVARAAGVENIVCSAPTSKKTGKIHPNTLYAMKTAGATQILALGGVQVETATNLSSSSSSTFRALPPLPSDCSLGKRRI